MRVAFPRPVTESVRPALVEVEDVHHRYRNGIEVLSGIHLAIASGEIVALVGIACNTPGVKLVESATFVALDATRTFSVQPRDIYVPTANVLADPAAGYIKRIRAGFILLEAGMALGLISKLHRCDAEGARKHRARQPILRAPVRGYRGEPSRGGERGSTAGHQALRSGTPVLRRVLQARLRPGELSVEAAHFAMLHQGARGYVRSGIAQRRLREAYFVAIVTPATKHLRKMLSEGST